VVTCCAANADYIVATVPAADLRRLLVIHHGVELGGSPRSRETLSLETGARRAPG